MNQTYYSVIGLPRSGKTTYLAALWYSLVNNDVETRLVLHSHLGDHRHLNRLAESWAACEEVERTQHLNERDVTMCLKHVQTGSVMELRFPDTSGERFSGMVELRNCPEELVEAIDADEGVILFVNANKKKAGLRIEQFDPDDLEADDDPAIDAETANVPKQEPLLVVEESRGVDDAGADSGALDEEPQEGGARKLQPWSPAMIPTDVQLVELLQTIQEPPQFSRRQRRLAVVVSAWDTVDPQLSPARWLQRELPFLHQFLQCRTKLYSTMVFGISSTGGTVSGKSPGAEERRNVIRAMPVRDRIKCLDSEGESLHGDLTAPMIWAMGLPIR